MPRLLSWPNGITPNEVTPLSGPRGASGGQQRETLTGFTQTVASPFGAWRFRFKFPRMRDQSARRMRGLIIALHGGANAVRIPIWDADTLSFSQAGTSYSAEMVQAGVSWSNGLPWSEGQNWRPSRPVVAVNAASAKGDSVVRLADQFWRNNLGCGDQIGFMPFHLGLYVITEVIGGGSFRIWPPLRAAISTMSFATLDPVIAMRLDGESSATMSRPISATDEVTLTMSEVPDETIRAYYEG